MSVLGVITSFLTTVGVHFTRSMSVENSLNTPENLDQTPTENTSPQQNSDTAPVTTTDDEPLNLGDAGIDEPHDHDVRAGNFSIDPDLNTENNTAASETPSEPETLG